MPSVFSSFCPLQVLLRPFLTMKNFFHCRSPSDEFSPFLFVRTCLYFIFVFEEYFCYVWNFKESFFYSTLKFTAFKLLFLLRNQLTIYCCFFKVIFFSMTALERFTLYFVYSYFNMVGLYMVLFIFIPLRFTAFLSWCSFITFENSCSLSLRLLVCPILPSPLGF